MSESQIISWVLGFLIVNSCHKETRNPKAATRLQFWTISLSRICCEEDSPLTRLSVTISPMAIRVALIDMDGTIWDAPIDWPQVRRAIGLPWDGRPILEHLAEMPPKEREHGLQILEQHEAQGVEHGTIVPGTFELLGFLKASHIKCALVSNNSRQSVAAAC